MTTTTTAARPAMRTAAGAPTAFGYAPPPPTDPERATRNLETARRYLAAIEGGATGATLAAFYTPDVEQVEYPNRLLPMGATRDLAALLDGAARGQQVVRTQRYEVRSAHAAGEHVILELLWVATLARSIGMLLPGHEMRAHFAVVLEFRDGRIARQRNYDCFEPF